MIHCFLGQFITNEVAKKNEDKSETSNGASKKNNNYNNNKKNLKVNVDSKAADSNPGQVDDGFGSLPITPTDLGKNKGLSVLKKGEADSESIPTDDGIYTSSEETIHRQSYESVSDQLSGASSEDVSELSSGAREDNNGNIRTKRQDSGKKINQVSKVCSGSVSRGLEKFKERDSDVS